MIYNGYTHTHTHTHMYTHIHTHSHIHQPNNQPASFLYPHSDAVILMSPIPMLLLSYPNHLIIFSV